MIKEEEIIEVGKFLKPHGLKGELNVVTDYDAELLAGDYPLILDVDGIYVPFYASSVRPKGHFSSLITIEGIDSKEEAARLVNKIIYMRREDVAHFLGVDPDEVGLADDLIGYHLVDQTLGDLGEIIDVDDSTENVLLEVEREDGRTFFVPYVEDFIKEIDDEAQEIKTDIPSDLLDLG